MKRKLLSIGILGIALVALVACGSNEKSDQTTEKITSESTTLDNTSEQETTTGETEDEATENVTSNEITNESTIQESTTEGNTTQQTTTVAKPTETTTTKQTDKNADYKEIENYAKSLGCDYTYVKSAAEYKKYAEAHEGKKFAIICKENLFLYKEDKFYELSTYDMVKELDGESNDSYECHVFDWVMTPYINETIERYDLVKNYIVKSEKDIDTAIADMKKMETMGKQIFIAFTYRQDIVDLESIMFSKMKSADFDDSFYVPAPYTGSGMGASGYYLYTYVYYMNWQPNPTVPDEITIGAAEYKQFVREIAMLFPTVEYKYFTSAAQFIEYAESHVGQQFGIIYPKGKVRNELVDGVEGWPLLSILESYYCSWCHVGEYFEYAIIDWVR